MYCPLPTPTSKSKMMASLAFGCAALDVSMHRKGQGGTTDCYGEKCESKDESLGRDGSTGFFALNIGVGHGRGMILVMGHTKKVLLLLGKAFEGSMYACRHCNGDSKGKSGEGGMCVLCECKGSAKCASSMYPQAQFICNNPDP